MKKDRAYFPHDYHARNDEKIIAMLSKMQWEGYGIYWAMIEKLYAAGGELKADYDLLAFDMRTQCDRIKSVVQDFDLFYFSETGGIRTMRVDFELNQRTITSTANAKAAASRWSKNTTVRPQCGNDAPAMRPHELRNARIGEDKIREDKITIDGAIAPKRAVRPEPKRNTYPAEFEQFWRAYPKKTGKVQAAREWAKIKPDLAVVLSALAWQKKSLRWAKAGEDGQAMAYVPDPERYIKYRRFEDAPDAYGYKPAQAKPALKIPQAVLDMEKEQERRAALTPEQKAQEDALDAQEVAKAKQMFKQAAQKAAEES